MYFRLVIIVVAAVLFVPVRYKADADYHGKFKAHAKLSWLGILRVLVSYDEELAIKAKALFITIYSNNQKKEKTSKHSPHYTMKRQLDDFIASSIANWQKRFQTLAANDNAKAKEIAAWKEDVVAKWDSIEIVSCDKVEELKNGDIESGKEYTITYVIDEKGLNDAVGLELVTTSHNCRRKTTCLFCRTVQCSQERRRLVYIPG